MKKLCLVLFAITILLTSCNGKIDENKHKTQTNTQISEKSISYGKNIDDDTIDASNIKIKNSFILDIIQVNKRYAFVFYTKNKENNSYLTVYDYNEKKCNKEILISDNFDDYDYYINDERLFVNVFFDNNTVQIIGDNGKSNKSSKGKNLIKVYDLNLNELLNINFIKNNISEFKCVSPDLKSLVFLKEDSKSIEFSDINFKNKKTLLKLSERDGELSQINKLYFIDNKKIAFSGHIASSDPVNENSTCFGYINADKTNYELKAVSKINENFSVSNRNVLIFEDHTEYGKSSSGQMYLIDDNIQQINTVDKNESQNALLSNGGNYIITYLEGKQKSGKEIIRFSIYDTKGKRLSTFDKEYNCEFGSMLINSVYACENTGLILFNCFENGTRKLVFYKMFERS